MTPTILEGDLVFVNKIAYDLRIPLTRWRIYRWSQPVKGDMVVCFSPEDHKRLVKRVIGEPGDIITMKRGVLWINGEPLKYKKIENPYIKDLDSDLLRTSLFALEYLGQQCHTIMIMPQIHIKREFGPIRIPEDRFFLMGDNRDNSHDSRYFGFVERDEIIGRVEGVIGSLNIKKKYRPRFSRFFKDID